MRIASVALGVEPRNMLGGVGRKLRAQVELWGEMGHAVQWFALVAGSAAPGVFTYSAGTELLVLKQVSRAASRGLALARLVGEVRRFHPDVIYLRSGPYVFPSQDLFKVAPVVLELNSNDVAERALRGWTASAYNRLTRGILLRRAAGLVAVTQEIAMLPANRRYGKPVAVIGNGIDLGKYLPLPAPAHAVPTITLIGSPGMPWHGADKLVRLAELCPELKIVIGGYTEAGLGGELPPNMTATGFLEPAQVQQVLADTDVACGSLALHRNNMQEGSTLKVPEALALGIPVLLAYRDISLEDVQSDCILRLPNTEDNVASHAEEIRDFAFRMLGRRVPREAIAGCIDQRIKEQQRLAFFQQVIPGVRRGG